MAETGSLAEQSIGFLHGVAFEVGDEEFVLDIALVEQITRVEPITAVPRVPDYVLGVINLRGKVIPVISARLRLGLAGDVEPRRIIIAEISGKLVGLLVDNVTELVQVPADQVVPAPPFVAGIRPDFISGIARLEERLLIVLSETALLDAEETET